MWLRRQDELNEARPTERFSTAIRLLSGRAGMERRYAKDLRARSAEAGEPDADAPDAVTASVDVRAFAMPPTSPQPKAAVPQAKAAGGPQARAAVPERDQERVPDARRTPPASAPAPAATPASATPASAPSSVPAQASAPAPAPGSTSGPVSGPLSGPASGSASTPAAARAAAARARRSKVLARRRRTTVVLFLAFTLGAIVAAVGGLAFLWAPGVPAVLLSAYIAHLRSQERRRFAYQMDRRRAEAAAQRLRERQPRRRASASGAAAIETGPDADAEEPHESAEPETDPGLLALAADRRALVEQTDHAEWVDQQRERQRRPGHGESWDPVPVPLPTYVTAPVAPRATSDVDLGAPDTWSSARSSSVTPEETDDDRPAADTSGGQPREEPAAVRAEAADERSDERSDARRAASARRSRERGRTPLFDQYEDGDRPRAANE
jgi:hypothetical protein